MIALLRSSAQVSRLWHPTQLQPSQVRFSLKQSQYNFRHLDFRQLHCTRLPEGVPSAPTFPRDFVGLRDLLSSFFSSSSCIVDRCSECSEFYSRLEFLLGLASSSSCELSSYSLKLLGSSPSDSKMIRPPMAKSIASLSPSTRNLELSLGRGVVISCISGKGVKNGSEVRVSILGGNGNGDRMEKMLPFGYGRCLLWGVFGWSDCSEERGGTSEAGALQLGVKLVGLTLIQSNSQVQIQNYHINMPKRKGHNRIKKKSKSNKNVAILLK